jgi:hypothetical protein
MTVKTSPGVFRWGYVFQRGDLPIFITDPAGNPADPFKITYSLSFQPKGAPCPRPAGPCDRVPVHADVGEYYVSGVAGQCGQPGQWFVDWKYQESFGSQLIADRMGFQVFDTAQLAPVTYVSYPCGCSSGSGCGCSNLNPRGGCEWGCRNPCLRTVPCGKFGW